MELLSVFPAKYVSMNAFLLLVDLAQLEFLPSGIVYEEFSNNAGPIPSFLFHEFCLLGNYTYYFAVFFLT
jgi:hypothetical protein